MITVAFYNAITFSVYEAALKRIKEHKQLGAGIHQNVLAGLASGLARVRYSFAYWYLQNNVYKFVICNEYSKVR